MTGHRGGARTSGTGGRTSRSCSCKPSLERQLLPSQREQLVRSSCCAGRVSGASISRDHRTEHPTATAETCAVPSTYARTSSCSSSDAGSRAGACAARKQPRSRAHVAIPGDTRSGRTRL